MSASSNTIPGSLERLWQLPRFGSGPGLERARWLASRLEAAEWLAGLDAIKVTGSNGKGSTAAMTAAILQALGVSCGLYTSPHFLRFEERVRFAGVPLDDASLEASAAWTAGQIERYGREHPGDAVGAFEAFTALALHAFAARRPAAVVAEAGIGGRFDPVRTFPGSLAGLTSVDLEHTELLGGTLEEIALDKAQLCPEGGTVVVGDLPPGVTRVLEAACRDRGVELVRAGEVFRPEVPEGHGTPCPYGLQDGPMVVDVDFRGERLEGLELGLAGRHQVDNAAVAVVLADLWRRRHLTGVGEEDFHAAVRAGLAAAHLPGRFERVGQDPAVYVDAGHTPAAARAAAAAVRDLLPGERVLLLAGISAGRDAEGILGPLAAVAHRAVATRARHRGAPAELVEEVLRAARPDLVCERAETVAEALEQARERAAAEGLTVLVAGGLFLAAEAAEVLRGGDPAALRFL